MTGDEQWPRIGGDSVSNSSGSGADFLGYQSVRGYFASWDESHDLDDFLLEGECVFIVEFQRGWRLSTAKQIGHVFCKQVFVSRWFPSIETLDVACQISLKRVSALAEG
jgi:hypothetical protein